MSVEPPAAKEPKVEEKSAADSEAQNEAKLKEETPKEEQSPKPSPKDETPPRPAAAKSPPPPAESPRGENPSTPEGNASPNQKIDANNSNFRDFNNIVTTVHVRGGEFSADLSLVEYVTELPAPPLTDPSAAAFLQNELRAQLDCLQRDRMILVSCSDPGLSRAAVWALVELLNVSQAGRKMLNFDRLPAGAVPSIYQLTSKRILAESDAVVVVDAARSDRAQAFVDSMHRMDGNWSNLDRTKSLQDAGLWLICAIDPERMATSVSNVGKLPVECWSISYLRFHLRSRFPQTYGAYETTITRQRADGGWASDAADFHEQIKKLSDQELIEAIGRQGIATSSPNEGIATTQPLQLPVLYTATFYPNLSPHEFSELIVTFLGKQTTRVTETIHQKGKGGVLEAVELKRDRPLVDLWREDSDAVLRECHLVTTRGPKRSIGFADPGRRDQMRRYFEESYGIYVHKQFAAAYENNLLFEGSELLAQNVIALTIDMSTSFGEQFDVDWLMSVVVRACSSLPEDDPVRSNRTYQRIVDLLRPMLGDANLASNVTRLLRKLLDGAHHRFVFEILKKLRFVPGLDVFLWLRQVVDQGTDEVRWSAYSYLYNELNQPGRTYPLLYTLKSWLPPADRQEPYSASQQMAFQLAFDYCLVTTREFDRRHSGEWPSRFPLFAVDAKNASEPLGLIVQWLFHPGLASVVAADMPPEELDRLFATLFAEWMFILVGAPADEVRIFARSETAGIALPVLAEGIMEILISKLVEVTASQPQRQGTMTEYWELMKQYYLDCVADPNPEMRRRVREFAWKRELVRKIITRFRESTLRPFPRRQQAAV
ncbi:MAG TPA: hypothetical protein VKB93_14570 [Thermoanaerobaculia bacterium]|nr:hypothetical protein [Thermoanaerobaculia bacterium]